MEEAKNYAAEHVLMQIGIPYDTGAGKTIYYITGCHYNSCTGYFHRYRDLRHINQIIENSRRQNARSVQPQ